MKGVVNREVICDVRVSIGVDTHQDEQVIIALNQEGVRSAERDAQRPVTAMGSSRGSPETWVRFVPSTATAGVHMAPDLPAS